MPSPEAIAEEIRALTVAADDLAEKVTRLNRESGNQLVGLSHRAKVNRRLIWVIAASLALDFILTVSLVLGFFNIDHLSHAVENNTNQIKYNQTVQRQKALCPLYQLFLDSKSPQGRAAAPDPVKYDNAFKVIQSGYDALGCNDFNSK